MTPLKIGEALYAEKEGNGISGYVAAVGEPYLCNDIAADPLYREGLDEAASALTVPLRLHDRVIGVFNIESNTKNAFTENDRRFAQIFGRYVAMAMHILDLLVVERYTTNETVAQNVLSELSEPSAGKRSMDDKEADVSEQAQRAREPLALPDAPSPSAGVARAPTPGDETVDLVAVPRQRAAAVPAEPEPVEREDEDELGWSAADVPRLEEGVPPAATPPPSGTAAPTTRRTSSFRRGFIGPS